MTRKDRVVHMTVTFQLALFFLVFLSLISLSEFWAQVIRPGDHGMAQTSVTAEAPDEVRPLPAEIFPGTSLSLYKWESATDRLFFFRSAWDQPSTALSIYSKGEKLVGAISPLKDIREAKKVLIYDAATDKDSGVILLVTLTDSLQRVSHGFLIYSKEGNFLRMIRTNPYHHVRMALDPKGNIYGFGEQESSLNNQYGLIVKYSSLGGILASFHWRSQFDENDLDLVTGGPSVGQPFLWIEEASLNLYMPSIRSLFKFNLNGNLISKSLFPADRMELNSQCQLLELIGLVPMKENTYLAQARYLTSKNGMPPSSHIGLFLWNAAESSLGNWSRVPSRRYVGRLIGRGADDSIIFFVEMKNGPAGTGIGKYFL